METAWYFKQCEDNETNEIQSQGEGRPSLSVMVGPFQGIFKGQGSEEWSHSHSLPHRETVYIICESPVFKHLVPHESFLLCTYLTLYV